MITSRHCTALSGQLPMVCCKIFNLLSIVALLGSGIGLLFTPQTYAEQLISKSVSVNLTQASPTLFNLSVSTPVVKSELVSTSTGQFDRLTIEDELTIGRPGWPDLPVISRTILIPARGALNLNITNIVTREEAGLRPLSAPPSDIDDLTAGNPCAEYLASDGWFPPEPIAIDQPAIMRGYRMVTVYTFPVQYNPKTGVTRFNDELEYNLSFSGTGINEVNDPSRIPTSHSVRKALENMVINPPILPVRDDILTGNYLYVALNNQNVINAITPLVEWRRRMGHKVAVATVEANANVAAIRNVILNAYNSNTPPEFVCLIGDAAGGQINVAAASQTGDYEYTRLDGDDPLPDVALGRLSAATVNQLQTIVNKIVSYETTPYMANTSWYRQAMVVAGHMGNGIGEVHLAHWVRMQLEAYGFNEIHSWYWNVNGEAEGNQEFLSEAFRWGISVLHYRAFSHMNQLPLAVITNLPNQDGRWPAVLAISCNTGNFVTENNGNYQGIGMTEEFLRARGGGIGAIGTATPETNVRFNNLVAAGVWKGVYEYNMYSLGWGLNQGKYEIWRAYHGFDDGYANFMDWNNLMGDPGTSIWTGVPLRIDVTHPAQIAVTSNLVFVEVVEDANGDPVEGAQVCIYKANQYQIVGKTDADGRVWLTMPDGIGPGVAKITVVKHNVYPYQGEITFTEPAVRLQARNFSIDDDQEGQSDGNGDGGLNPGERIELVFDLFNPGRDAIDGNVDITISSLTPYAEVIDEAIDLDDAPAPGESTELRIVIEIAESVPDAELIRLQFDLAVGNETWKSVAELSISAPNIKVQNLILQDDELLPGQIKTIDIQALNYGTQPLSPGMATLISLDDAVTVLDGESSFPRIPINSARALNGSLFRLRAHPLSIPGTRCQMILVVESEEGFCDSAEFELVLGVPAAGDPFGPDEYGYVCYDSEDDEWDMAPEYNWIEINPAIQQRQFNGTVLNLTDTGDNQDASVVVNMPWDFQYYGETYRQLTICSNGWAAFGDQHFIANFRNQHIAQALAPKAMLAVWWDNLITIPNTSKIVTYNDRNNGRFIVEWSQMRRLVEAGQGADETFQLILYDPARWETITGDGIITYQYNNVTNQNLIAHNDIPFCTIGIGSPDGMEGMEYTYWNTYPPGATRVANGLAITFTTQSTTRTGVIQGIITDVETGEPLVGAQVLTTRSFWAETDANGFYRIDDILVGEGYDLTATALGWNDSTLTGFDVAEDETLTVDFALLHPTFRLSHNRLQRDISIGNRVETEITISNDGNGSLVWEGSPRVIQEEERPIWEHVTSVNVGQIADDDRIEGGVFADGHFFVCGSNANDPNVVYKISRDGELVGAFEQAGTSNYGYKDLAWDGHLIWGSGEDSIFGFTTDGEVIARFLGPQSPQSALTYDSDRDVLWSCSVTSQIVAVNGQGQRVGRAIPNRLLRIYGLAYYPADPDGKTLYIQTREANTNRQLLYRVNPDAGDPEFLHEMQPPGAGSPTGTEISGIYDPLNWVYINIMNALPAEGRDRLDIYQLAPRNDWMRTTPLSGTILPGESQEITVSLGAPDLPLISLEGDLHFIHNAAFGQTSLPVSITIIPGPGGLDERTWTLNRGWNLVSLNIVPEELNVVELTRPLLEDGFLQMMKDGEGRFYNPAADFNNIPSYDTTSGYQVYVNENSSLIVRGTVIDPGAAITLTSGWNMTAYYPREPLPAEVALSGLGDALTIAKNISGRFYLPAYDFNNLGNLGEGFGYLIKVNRDVDLVYPVVEQEDRASVAFKSPEHFIIPQRNGENHSLLLIGEPEMAGWEAAVVDFRGKVVGAGVLDPSGRAGVAIFRDDATTSEAEGLQTGGLFSVKLWDGKSEKELPLEILEGNLSWSVDGLTVVKINSTQIPADFGLYSAYPNPFNSSTKISFGLPSTSEINLAIFDLSGRQISRLATGEFKAGSHSVVWQGDGTPSGIYIIRLDAGGKVMNRKVALIR